MSIVYESECHQAAADAEDSPVLTAIREKCQAGLGVTYVAPAYEWSAELDFGSEVLDAGKVDSDLAWQLGWIAFKAFEALGNSSATAYFANLFKAMERKQADAMRLMASKVK